MGDDATHGPRSSGDAFGEVMIPDGARWGAATQRAVVNFPVSGMTQHPELLRQLVRIKRAAAIANAASSEVAAVTDAIASAIVAAADRVLAGECDDQFPVDVFQTGSGTSTNMNVNEVLASLASEHLGEVGVVHPNDHVNASQSSNDVFPTAIRLAVLVRCTDALLPALDHLASTLRAKAGELAAVVKAGRTHLMDATPVTLGQELGGHATQVEHARAGVAHALEALRELPLGGTATGTGINAPATFASDVIGSLAGELGQDLAEAADHFALQGGQDALAAASSAVRTAAIALLKIANDLRLLASGPATGLAEISLPALQAGSSIMPGKVNPVIPEAVSQVVAHVFGCDATVAFACSQGTLELNTYLPVIAHNLLEEVDLLAAVARLFADACIAGIAADSERARRLAESSPAIVTALVPLLGYDVAASVAREALAQGRTIREVVVDRGLVAEDELDVLLDVRRMANP